MPTRTPPLSSPPAGKRKAGFAAAEPGASPFDALPPEMIVRAFGVDYGHVLPPEGGDLYVTRYGWPQVERLLPANWYAGRWYVDRGTRLPGASGSVYHVKTRPVRGRSADVVVKFSRMAQDVPIEIASSFPDDVPVELIADARVNSPLEEFGLVMEMRHGAFGPRDLRIQTQRPLAIYAPPEEYPLWQLGRDQSFFQAHNRLLEEDQERAAKAIELDIRRIYVLLYGWIRGKDAEEYFLEGTLGEEEFQGLTPRVIAELKSKGFRVLDNKPKHFILRRSRRRGEFLRRRDGLLVYGLVDFEFLQRTPEHRKLFKASQRRRYWSLPDSVAGTPAARFPTHLKPAEIFGVPYVHGTVPDGGKVWVVGRNPGLFDYFLPDRWRRTPRVKLSLSGEVYRTRTRDGIHMVYRRSRVGIRPRIDPLVERDRRVREHGYNSPFEEIAIAERLRQMGIRTTRPRAVCRTGHFSTKANFIRDLRRFDDHARLPGPEQDPGPILSPDYDYYTLWDCFRGVDARPEAGGAGVADLEQLREDGALDEHRAEDIAAHVHHRLRAIGLAGGRLEDHEIVLRLDERGRPLDDEEGRPCVTLTLDALTAYEHDLLDERAYRDLMTRLEESLKAVDCEILNPSGSHLLVSMDPDGRFRLDDRGEIIVTLCNFELIRGLYRPFR